MKRIARHIVIILLLFMPLVGWGQKYACVNTEYILSNIPDYERAQTQLNRQSEEWQKELEAKFQEIDKLYKTFHQEAYLLPENLKRKREEEIKAKEREAKELQTKYFGPGGDLDKKRAELMKPIQERVYSTIERIANEKRYDFILDKSGSVTLLYVNAKYDVSDQVLEMMGYKPGANKATGGKESGGKDSGIKDGGGKRDSGGRKDADRDNPSRKKEVDNPEMRKSR